MLSKPLKDPVVLTLVGLMVALFAVYQIGGGQDSSHVLIRDCVNVLWYAALPVLLAYLLVRPILKRSLEKSSSTKVKALKTALGG